MSYSSTQVRTHNPARADVPVLDPKTPARTSRRWALAGAGAGLAGVGVIVTTTMIDAVYDPALAGDTTKISAKLATQIPQMIGFHVLGMIGAVLMIVFAAGLFRRLRAADSDGIAPLVAFTGLVGTAFVLILGTGLNTEFLFGVGNDEFAAPANAAMYNHWIGTIPWIWALAGLAGVALKFVADLPAWIRRVGLIGGGLTLFLGISPLQYMAGFTGPVIVTIIALGFFVGDKAHRA